MTSEEMERFDRLPQPVRRALIGTVMNIQNMAAIERACATMPAESVADHIRHMDGRYVTETTVLR